MPTLFTLLLTFFEIGAVTFGGGYAMIPLIQSKLVGNGWLSMTEVTDMIAIAEMTPGPFAVNIATFTGIKLLGIPGGIACTLGVVLPSLCIIFLIATVFHHVQDNIYVKAAMKGIHPAVVGLIATAVLSLGRQSFFPAGLGGPVSWLSVALAAAAFFAIKKLGLNPILAILATGAAGVFLF
ncbi:MAG: chromate transporter [Clostridia bacterium]|nr:chromate transporter [Clostridia bacterium]